MVNYQLYRTNVLLGGQMKYDLIVGLHDQNLIVEDFQISPISKNINYDKFDSNLLNYTHLENIKSFYKSISPEFYNTHISPSLSSQYPIITEDEDIKTYDDTYEMGCRRGMFQLYGKQFEFFCPLWLENVKEGDNINFQFEIFGNTLSKDPFCVKNLILKPINNCEFHNKFVNYIKQYIKEIGIEKGTDELLNIDPLNKTAAISGINIEKGLGVILEDSTLIENIFNREIPLIETDNYLINFLKMNKIIARQLFNFNICFNIDDLIPHHLLKELYGKSLTIRLKVGIGEEEGNLIDLMDFYSNYDYIPRQFSGKLPVYTRFKARDVEVSTQLSEPYDQKYNVLNYLKDNICQNYIQKNKISQQIIHWSLADNNEYIFNIYNGFGGYYIENVNNEQRIKYIDKVYGNAPLITDSKYSPANNSLNWCNNIKLTSGSNMHPGVLKELSKYCSKFEVNGWVNGLKYEKGDLENHINLLFVEIPDKQNGTETNFNTFLETFDQSSNIRPENSDDRMYVFYETNTIFIFCKRVNIYTYENFILELGNLKDEQPLLEKLYKFLIDNRSRPSLQTILLKKSLSIHRVDGPSLSTNEIEYYKSNNPGSYCCRYFGKIKPTFISSDNVKFFNYKYSKLVYTKNSFEKSDFRKYINSGYPPIYPSINYFYLLKNKENYNTNAAPYKTYEWQSFNNNELLVLKSEFDILLMSGIDKNTGEKTPLSNLIKQFLESQYNIKSDNIIDYIYDLYEYEYSFDYIDKEDIQNYKYYVKIKLK